MALNTISEPDTYGRRIYNLSNFINLFLYLLLEYGHSEATKELLSDLMPLRKRLEEAKNVNEIHTKNIDDMLKIKAEIGSKRTHRKREKKKTGYLKTVRKAESKRPTTNHMVSREEPNTAPPALISINNRSSTANNFYPTEIFSKTSLENAE